MDQPTVKSPFPAAAQLFHRAPAPIRGMTFMLIAGLATAAMNALVRAQSSELHPFEIAFFRNFFGLLWFLPAFIQHGLGPLKTRRAGLHLLRGALTAAVTLAFFMALQISPLAKVMALQFSAPLFGTLLAIILLRELVRAQRVAALVFGFSGTLVIVRPGLEAVDLGTVLVLFSAATWGVGLVVTKVLARTDSPTTMTIHLALCVTPVALVAAVPVWETPSLEQVAWLALIGGLGTLAQMSLAQAFREAEATAVLPFDFAKLIWAAVIGYFAFAEVPDLWTWVGGIMIFSAATTIAYRESRLKGAAPGVAAGAVGDGSAG